MKIKESLCVNEDVLSKEQKLIAENEELKDKLATVENKNVEITMLFNLIAHDLRSPFQGIIGFSEVCKDDLKNGDLNNLNNYLTIIENSAEGVLVLLDDLLLWSKLNMNKIEVKNEIINLKNNIEENLKFFDLIKNKKNISILNNIEDENNIFVDKIILNNALRNLVSNAIKFTPEGGIITLSSQNVDGKVKIFIKDNGIGITKDRLENIFNQVGYTTKGTSNEKGSGLGLSIVYKMIEKLGGKIEVESDGEGKGSTFIITIPEVKE